MFDVAWAMAPAQGSGPQDGTMSFISSVLPIILVFIVFYFLLIRPQQKRAKEHKKLLENLKKGDKIITTGGICGVIESVETNTVVLKIAENVKIKLNRGYVAGIRPETEEN